MFRRLLIANRGEIARRVVRACDALGIESIAVFSEADRNAPFVREASHSICIGPAKAAHSYLAMESVLEAALQTEAQAIHPGYGFLSENPLFAQMVLQQRLGWVGPPPHVIRLMGEKASAKAAMRLTGLPLIPGSDGLLKDLQEALKTADRIGYPVLLKADAGGGGRGMRRANDAEGLARAWDEARSEALAAFGSDAMYLEKFLGRARHIEFQVLADRWGHAVHLFERECSVQRRHQKLLEEAPSCILSDEERRSMGERVAQAAAALGYEGAGTVEFLRSEEGELYFIEMNTRLQVEHPVTEEVTGIDLVQAQIRIAAGERLWMSQEEIHLEGHAIELRLNAEDPDNNFRPDPGLVERFSVPTGAVGAGRVRMDAAIDEGSRVSPYYDSMVAKLIAWAPDRASAISLSTQSLNALVLEGIQNTAGLHRQILTAKEFEQGDLQVGVIPGRPDLNDAPGAKG